MASRETRAIRREQVERCLSTSGMTVKEWCGLNGVPASTMYFWMSKFRKEEPELFGKPKDDAKVEEILRALTLWDKRKTILRELSGGMKRRVMIARALKGYLVESVSKDGGETWSEVTQTAIEHPHTRPFIRRLPSGRVLLINNEHKKARINLKVYLSEDDAHTWKHTMMLDSRQTSYPDAVFGDHGEIYIIHDHGRESFKEILVSRITEEDIMAGEIVSHDSYANHIIAKGPSVPELGEEFRAASRAEFEKFLKEIGEVK